MNLITSNTWDCRHTQNEKREWLVKIDKETIRPDGSEKQIKARYI